MKKILISILAVVLIVFVVKNIQKEKLKDDTVSKNTYERKVKRDHDEGDNFIDASTSDPVTLNPVLYRDMASGRIIEKLFNSLIDYNESSELEGDLARSFSTGTSETVFYINTPIYKDIVADPAVPDDIKDLSVSSVAYHNYYIDHKDKRFNAFSVKEYYDRISLGEVINNTGKREIGDVEKLEILGDATTHQPCIIRITLNEPATSEILKNWEKLSPEPGLIRTAFEMKLEFILRDYVKFHDGIKCTVDDVLFTYEQYLKSDNKFMHNNVYSVTVNSETNKIVVRYKGVFATALQQFGGMSILPKHVFEQPGIDNDTFGRNPIGTGPFMFSQWETDSIVVLDAYDAYFKGRPYIDKYVCRTIPDYKIQLEHLTTEEIDYMLLSPTELKQLDKKTLEKYNIYTFFKRSYNYIGYNLSPDHERAYIFRDQRIRRAITYAINRRKIINKVFLGKAAPCTGPFYPGSWAYNRNVTTFSYNPSKSQQILDEAGWVDSDGNGIRDRMINGEKKELIFDLMISRGADETKIIAEFIKEQLKNIGIQINIRTFEWSAYVNIYAKEKSFDAVLASWGLSVDPDLYQIWHSDNISETGSNLTGYKDKQVDDLIIKAQRTIDQEKRKDYYHQIHEIIAQQQPYTFLWVTKRIIAVHKRFQGFKNIELFSELWPPKRDKIWVDKEDQKY